VKYNKLAFAERELKEKNNEHDDNHNSLLSSGRGWYSPVNLQLPRNCIRERF